MKQFNIYLAQIVDGEATKKVLIISPNEMNESINTVIVAPIIKFSGQYPTRLAIKLNAETQYIVLEQLQTIDKTMIKEELSTIDESTQEKLKSILKEMFA